MGSFFMTQRRIYQDEYPYFVTFLTREGYPLFERTKYVELLSKETFVSAQIKRFDVLSYQIMLDHVHILTCKRTLEKVRLGDDFGRTDINIECTISTESTLSSVRSDNKHQHTISDLIQSVKGNFSRKVNMGNIWQRRFYARIVDNRKYLEMVVHYIKQNPIKAELPPRYCKFPYQYIDWESINMLF